MLSSTLAKVGDSLGILWLHLYTKQIPMLPFDIGNADAALSEDAAQHSVENEGFAMSL